MKGKQTFEKDKTEGDTAWGGPETLRIGRPGTVNKKLKSYVLGLTCEQRLPYL